MSRCESVNLIISYIMSIIHNWNWSNIGVWVTGIA